MIVSTVCIIIIIVCYNLVIIENTIITIIYKPAPHYISTDRNEVVTSRDDKDINKTEVNLEY